MSTCYDLEVETPRLESTSLSDLQQLVERAQAGERDAFDELYARHVGRIFALCLRMSGNRDDATELTQQAFVRAWDKLGTFGGHSAFGSWLHRLAVNVVLGEWRRRGRQRDRLKAFADRLADDAGTVREKPRLTVDLERAIRRLPKGARTVFVLHDVEGYRHREVAELTGLAIGTSKAQLHRARRLLREILR